MFAFEYRMIQGSPTKPKDRSWPCLSWMVLSLYRLVAGSSLQENKSMEIK